MKQMVTARRQRYWDLRAAGNFIGGGTGTGLIVAAALVAACGGAWQLPAILGPVCMALGLSAVWLEIGRPWRALHVFFHPQTSWMTREGILAGPVMAAAAAALVLGQPLLLALAVALAAGFLYCQARMLRASRGIPAWRQAEVVGLIAATAWAEGAGAALLLVLLAAAAAASSVALRS